MRVLTVTPQLPTTTRPSSTAPLARAVDAVIVKSPQMASIVAPVKAQVVPNGVDMDAFQPMEPCRARELLGWSQEKRYVLFPSSPDIPRKGFALAQAAVTLAAPR